MITNFVLNRSNVLYTFNNIQGNTQSNSQAIKYIKQQDNIVNNFSNILRDNVLRLFKGVKPQQNKQNKLNLPIKNALWYLWNNAYKLGIDNASSELRSKFNRTNNLVEFASRKSYDEEERERLLESEQELESRRKDDTDDYDLFTPNRKKNKLKSNKPNKKNTLLNNEQDIDRRINSAIKTEDTTLNTQSKINPAIQVNNNELANAKIELEKVNRQKEIFERNYITYDQEGEPVIKYNKYVRKKSGISNINASPADKQIIDKKYRNLRLQKLKLEDRIQALELDNRLKEMTKEDKTKEKRTREPRKLKESTIARREAISTISDRRKEEESRTPQDVQYSEFGRVYVEKRLDAVAAKLDDYYRDDLKEIIPKYLNSKSPTKDKELFNDINTKLFNKDENLTGSTKRIALTELGHAYNLGRMDYYEQKGIKKVKWNNSVEHLRRTNPKYETTYRKIYNKMSQQEKSTKPFEIKGVVCPVCQERAEKDNGYGKGVYLLSEVLSNPQLQPSIHPFCFCFLSPVESEDDDDDFKKRNKVDSTQTKVSSLFDSNVSKWAAGGATAILGTALMYSMFRRTRGRVVVPSTVTEVAEKVVTKIPTYLKPSVVPKKINAPKPTYNIPTSSDNLADVIIDNAETILEQLPEVLGEPLQQVQQASEYLVTLPMLNLAIPEKEVVEVVKQQYKPIVDAAINKTIPNTNFSYNTYLDTVTSNAQKTITLANETNPNSVNFVVQLKLDNINRDRLAGYQSYNSSTYDTATSKTIINSYSKDINFINNTLTNLENNNSKLYAEIRGLIKVRDEAIESIKPTLQNLPDNITPQDIISTHPTIVNLNNTLVDLSNSLAANKQRLNSDDLYGQLIETRQAILSNPELAQDYVRYNSKKINSIFNSLGSSDPAFIYNVDSQLNTLSSRLNKIDNLSKNDFLLSLDELEQVYKRVSKEKSKVNNITQIDLKEFIGAKQSKDNLIKASGILDYKQGIDTLENKILYITTLLLNKYK